MTTVDDTLCDARRRPIEQAQEELKASVKAHEAEIQGLKRAADAVADAVERIESFNTRMDERVKALENKSLRRLNFIIDEVVRWATLGLLGWIVKLLLNG
jgi:septal ring factor EnvC (AmiA/AmiB activator)